MEHLSSNEVMYQDGVTFLLNSLVKDSNDITFAREFFNVGQILSQSASPEIIFLFAERLYENGFNQEAEDILRSVVISNSNGDFNLLMAKISIALEKPRLALSHISGLPGPRFDLIRAEVYTDLGDHTIAHKLFVNAGDEPNSIKSAMASDSWSYFDNRDGIDFSELSLLRQSSLSDTEADENILRQAKTVVDESENARRILNEVLSEN